MRRLQKELATSEVVIATMDAMHEARANETAEAERKRDEAINLAIRDDLTAMFNKRYFNMRIAEEMARANRAGTPFAILFIDGDGLKGVNDKHGHLAGDTMIQHIGKIVMRNVRASDLSFRFGGDEFAVILPETQLAGAQNLAERIRKNIEREGMEYNGGTIIQTLSIGIAIFDVSSEKSMPQDVEERKMDLIERADAALYTAKIQRNCVVAWTPGMENPKKSDQG